MKKILIVLTVALCALACSNDDKGPLVGADRDEHGCIASAGYTWSGLKNTCIRLWEEGKALLPAQQTEGAVMAAYVVNAEDSVEVFLPGRSSAMLLTRQYVQGAPEWVSADGSGWKLMQDGFSGWQLYENGVLRYTSQSPINWQFP